MAHEGPWWNLSLATPAEQYWKDYGLPNKGDYGGRCHHITCSNPGADWYNKSSGKYYCDTCARSINQMCLQQGQTKLCELHI